MQTPTPRKSDQIEFLVPKDAQRSEMYAKQFFQTIIVWLFLEGGWFCILLSRTGPNIVSCKILNFTLYILEFTCISRSM